jgi:Aldehyde dehydrogenase family
MSHRVRAPVRIRGEESALSRPGRLFKAIPAALVMAFLNSGQACAAGTRLLVPRKRLETAKRAIVDAMTAFPVGDRRDFVGAKLSIFCTLESFGVVCRAPKKTIIALITLAAIGLDPLLARIESCANPHQDVRLDALILLPQAKEHHGQTTTPWNDRESISLKA